MDREVTTAPFDISVAVERYRPRATMLATCLVCWGALILVVVGVFVLTRGGGNATRYVTQEVTTGTMTVTVTATGSLEPHNQVNIGSELSGTIRTVNVDVNDEVKSGQVLAALDTSRLEAEVQQALSSLASTQARVMQSDAGLKEARARYARLLKVRELSGSKLPSQQDLDIAASAVARAEAAATAARAEAAQERANLEAVRTDLGKTEIRSPVDGVVLVRAVESGQTVAASLQAPVLFTLAEDLKKMELHVAVNEGDVGSVQVGQQATFTVDAFPSRIFAAEITRVAMASNGMRSAASSGDSTRASGEDIVGATGVVTYETVLEVDNSELLLRPGMTATADILTGTLSDAVLVPNVAMRFTPDEPVLSGFGVARPIMFALLPSVAHRWECPREDGQVLGCVWLLQEGKPQLALFRPGATDRSVTQVIDLERLPRWHSLLRLRSDPVLKHAHQRKIRAGALVIVGRVERS